MDTTTSYLGFRLPHPFVAGASPYGAPGFDQASRRRGNRSRRIALVDRRTDHAGDAWANSPDGSRWRGIFRTVDAISRTVGYPLGPDEYAEHIHRAKQAVRVPIIALLNCTSAESWLRFGRIIEQAGADALELNLYEVVTDLSVHRATPIEHELYPHHRELKRALHIPICREGFSVSAAFGHLAQQLDDAGADAIVLFNRFYQPDIDIKTMKPQLPCADHE